MKKKRRPNPVAKDLRTPKYRMRIVPNKKKEYYREHSIREIREGETGPGNKEG